MPSPPRAFRPGLSLTGFALACALLAFSPAARAQSPLGPQAGVIVLRGGEVVRGKISRVGEFYTVAFADQGEMRLPASAIDVRATDMDDAYGQLLARTDADDAGRQLALARWCLRQNLLQQAADRLLAATLLAPDHPEIASVETRLWLATHPAESAPPSAAPPEAGKSAVTRIWDNVPPGAVESFTSTVQPLLLNRCAGCHRPGAGLSFQLLRPLNGRSVSRSFTERNLAAVLAVCDREKPQESPLLAIPRSAHGGARPIIVSSDASQWQRVANWIEGLSSPVDVRLAGASPRRDGVLWQPSGAPVDATKDSPRQTSPTPGGERVPQPAENASAPAGEKSPPGDPFDPEIFNRRYGKGREQAKP